MWSAHHQLASLRHPSTFRRLRSSCVQCALLLNDAAKCLRDEGAAGSMERDGYPPSIRVLVPAMTPSLRSQDESIGKKNADHLARGQRPQFRITMAMETG